MNLFLKRVFVVCCFIFLSSCAAHLQNDVLPSGICSANSKYEGSEKQGSPAFPTLPKDRLNINRRMPAGLSDKLSLVFNETIQKTKATAGSVTIWDPKRGYWEASKGPDTADGYWVASTGKMITSSVILQMVSEGKLSLTSKLSEWFPEFPNAELITLDHLLSHTSGIYSFNSDEQFRKEKGYKSPARLLAIARKHKPLFCPGTRWNYSNTGYILLGLIAEKTDGAPLSVIVKRRIAIPLNLKSLKVVQANDSSSLFVKSALRPAPTARDVSTVYGAGGMIINNRDLLVFLHSYMGGKVVSLKTSLQPLFNMFQGPMYYGRGVMVVKVPDRKKPTIWVGHSGGSPATKSIAFYDVKRKVYITISLNINGPAEAMANSLLKVLD